MSNSIVTSVDEIQGYLLHDSKKELLKIKDKLITFSKSARTRISINDFKDHQSEENLNRLVKNICLKIECASKLLDDSISDLIEVQQQKDIAFLYLWSTLNEIFELRVKIDIHALNFLNREKIRQSIPFGSAESELNNNKRLDHKQKLYFFQQINKIRESIKKRNFDRYVRDHWLDLVRLLLCSEYYDNLYKFDRCRSRRNKLPMIHGNILRFRKEEDVNFETIDDIKHLIGLLLYLNKINFSP